MESVASQFAPCPETSSDPGAVDTSESRLSAAQTEGRYLRVHGWTSNFLPSPRDLFLYLPEAYLHEQDRKFPVLILHDGQNLFDGELSYVKGSTWRAGSTADEEIAAGRVEPLILVGVANTGVERMAEYTPTPDLRLGGGRGPFYARLLVEELLPMLRKKYRVATEPENVGIAGSSLGGLISLAIGLRYPDVFRRIGVLSPSIWWNNRGILRDLRALEEHLPLRIWLDIGTAEGSRHVRNTDLVSQLLQRKGWQPGVDLHYDVVTDGLHNEAAWADRFGRVLQFLFPPGRTQGDASAELFPPQIDSPPCNPTENSPQ